ncbi:hypothetical protein SE17_32250, partial [Kouleothrix aurantiaca]
VPWCRGVTRWRWLYGWGRFLYFNRWDYDGNRGGRLAFLSLLLWLEKERLSVQLIQDGIFI